MVWLGGDSQQVNLQAAAERKYRPACQKFRHPHSLPLEHRIDHFSQPS
jgi:hypothetical protein